MRVAKEVLKDFLLCSMAIGCGMLAVLTLDGIRHQEGWAWWVVAGAVSGWLVIAMIAVAACISGGRAERGQ